MTNHRKIEYIPLDQITPATRNPKTHHIPAIRASIARFGVASPALQDERTGRLVAGHGRTEALRQMRDAGETPPAGVQTDNTGTWLIPVVRGWTSRSDAEADAYLIADNQHTLIGGWNDTELGALLADINQLDPELFAVTGYDTEELEELLAITETEETKDQEEQPPAEPPPPPAEPITKPGDIWHLGPHRIICGDSRDYETVERLLGDMRVNVAFTSPPYASQRKYDESSGFKPIPPNEYIDWFEDIQANVRATLADDGSWFINIKEHCENGQRHLYVKDLTTTHVRLWGWLFVDELCWVDASNGFPGSFPNRFKDAWEPIFHFSTSTQIKFNPLANGHESGDVLRYRTDTSMDMNDDGYTVAGNRQYQTGLARPSNVLRIQAGGDGSHSAAFPVALPAWFIRAYSDPGDAIFDPFLGSGTTLMAAHTENRIGYGVEISPAYCDVICRRYQDHTGTLPVLHVTGREHDFSK